jgi:hypothetical protein
MVSPDAVARRPMKAVKSMTVTAVPYRQSRKNTASCLAQSASSRTANGALFPFVLRTGFRIGFRKGFVKRGFLVSRAITKLRVLAYQHCTEAGA